MYKRVCFVVHSIWVSICVGIEYVIQTDPPLPWEHSIQCRLYIASSTTHGGFVDLLKNFKCTMYLVQFCCCLCEWRFLYIARLVRWFKKTVPSHVLCMCASVDYGNLIIYCTSMLGGVIDDIVEMEPAHKTMEALLCSIWRHQCLTIFKLVSFNWKFACTSIRAAIVCVCR